MASLMAQMMDFTDELRDSCGYDVMEKHYYTSAMDIVDSFINNCHGMSSDDTLNTVRNSVNSSLGEPFFNDMERAAFCDALVMVDCFEEALS